MKKRALTYLFLLFSTIVVVVAEVWIGSFLKAPLAVIIPLVIASLVPLILHALYPYITSRWIGRVQRNGRQASAVVLEFQDYMAGIGHYEGSDLWIDVPVRVDTEWDGEFEARMKCRLSQSYVLKEGLSVTVRYDPADKRKVVLMDDIATILDKRTVK